MHTRGEFLAQKIGRLPLADIDVVAALCLRGWRENRFRQLGRFEQTGGQLDTADALVLLVFLPAGTGEVTPHNAFYRQRPAFSDDHGASFELLAVRLELCGEAGELGRQDVVWDDMSDLFKPELRDGREDAPLERNACGHDHVESRDAVGGEKQKPVAQVENLADLAATQFLQAGNVNGQKCLV